MRIGMNATAVITVEEKQDALTIPVNALQESGNQVFVYTSLDSEGNPTGETQVQKMCIRDRALIDACAARDALAVIDMRILLLILPNGAHLASRFTGALSVGNCAIWANTRALSAVDALFLVNVRLLVLVKADGAYRANILAAVRNASAA